MSARAAALCWSAIIAFDVALLLVAGPWVLVAMLVVGVLAVLNAAVWLHAYPEVDDE